MVVSNYDQHYCKTTCLPSGKDHNQGSYSCSSHEATGMICGCNADYRMNAFGGGNYVRKYALNLHYQQCAATAAAAGVFPHNNKVIR